jgi:hypothetical protein
METFGVTTKYYGPTNHRGSRIRVTSYKQSKFVSYSYADNDAHEAAVREVFGKDAKIERVCLSESSRGSVYSVTITEGE